MCLLLTRIGGITSRMRLANRRRSGTASGQWWSNQTEDSDKFSHRLTRQWILEIAKPKRSNNHGAFQLYCDCGIYPLLCVKSIYSSSWNTKPLTLHAPKLLNQTLHIALMPLTLKPIKPLTLNASKSPLTDYLNSLKPLTVHVPLCASKSTTIEYHILIVP